MLTQAEINEIERELLAGDLPETVAMRRGITRTALHNRLLQSGKRVVTYRRLENTAPADAPREVPRARL